MAIDDVIGLAQRLIRREPRPDDPTEAGILV
jgi:hypothetical protein